MMYQTSFTFFKQSRKGLFLTLKFACTAILLFFTPSVNFKELFLSEQFSKTLFLVYGVSIMVLFTFLHIVFLSKDRISLKLSKIDIALLVLIIYITINRYILQNYYGFSIRFIEFLGLSIMYIVLRGISLKFYPWLFLLIIASGIVQAILGNLQLLGYYPSNHPDFQITGDFFNPGPFAGFLAIIWSLTLGVYLFRDRFLNTILPLDFDSKSLKYRIWKVLFESVPLVGMIAIVIILPATKSRAAWLALIIGSIPLLVYRYSIIENLRLLRVIKKKILLIAIFLITTSIFFGLYHLKKESADGRLLIWKVSSKIIKEEPIFGIGFDRFKAYYMDAQANYFEAGLNLNEEKVAGNTDYAFNELIQFTVENGFIGVLLSFILVLFLFNTSVFQTTNYFKIISLNILLTVLVFSFFSYPAQILPIKMIIVVTLSLLAKVDLNKYNLFKEFNNGTIIKIKKNMPIKIILFTSTIAILWFVNRNIQNTKQAFEDWKIAATYYNHGQYGKSLREFEKVWSVLNDEGYFLMQYGKTLAMSGELNKAIDILNQSKRYLNTTITETTLGDAYKEVGKYKKAEQAYLHASHMIPSRFYPEYLLAKMYEKSGQVEKAKKKASEILFKEIKVPSIAIEEMKLEMQKILKNN